MGKLLDKLMARPDQPEPAVSGRGLAAVAAEARRERVRVGELLDRLHQRAGDLKQLDEAVAGVEERLSSSREELDGVGAAKRRVDEISERVSSMERAAAQAAQQLQAVASGQEQAAAVAASL